MNIDIGLVIGCARSGTSILAEAIAAHRAVKYLFEPHEIWELVGEGENGSHRLTAANATPEVRAAIRAWFAGQRGTATLVLDKTPRNALRVPFLRTVFPDAKIIHIVRDGRDVVCSLMPGVGGDTWNHLKPIEWRMLHEQHQGIERCARLWRDVVQTTLADLAGVPHLQVRYEELIADPRAVILRTWQFLGLPADRGALEFASVIQDATSGSYHAAKQDFWYRDDHTNRIGRWHENLDAQQQHTVEELLRGTLKELGYE